MDGRQGSVSEELQWKKEKVRKKRETKMMREEEVQGVEKRQMRK